MKNLYQEENDGAITSAPIDQKPAQVPPGAVSGAERELTVFASEPHEGGEGGEGGNACQISNVEFVSAVFGQVPTGAAAAICTKIGDPAQGGWIAKQAGLATLLSADSNNYVCCSTFYLGEDKSFKVRKDRFATANILVLDDIGTKVPRDRLAGFDPSWLLETSPGNYQAGIILAEPLRDLAAAAELLDAVVEAGLCDPGAGGIATRWARLPVGSNGKPKHAREGKAFRCRLLEWRPTLRYSPQTLAQRLKLIIGSRNGTIARRANAAARPGDEVLTPKAEENPIVVALKSRGLYKTPLGSGKHDLTCPWIDEHTDRLDGGAAYFEPDEFHPLGGFCCQHSHRDKYHIRELLDHLGVAKTAARHQPVIRLVAGELHVVVDAAERELAARGRHYQSGGLIVSVSTDPSTGDPSIIPTRQQALTRELSVAATWEKYDARKSGWVTADPPSKHIAILYESQSFRHLPPLAGLARQPYFREVDGALVTQPGYDPISQLFAVFDPRQFEIADPTPEAARAALAKLEELLSEFSFVSPIDRAAALSAMFTAVVRPTLAQAPAFHVRAPVMGSGKSYLCDLIGSFAGPGGNRKVSYPTTAEEATKAMLSLLLTGPAVVEFDDMDTDWTPHGTIKRMLTTDQITDRVLGVSKTATVSTRTLFLGSGNNVGPVRDLLRRVLTIHLDPRCATPATRTYNGSPVEQVRDKRGAYVAAVLTILQAWREAGSPRANVESIATFGGAWANYCRHPLLWLDLPDPATSLLEQIKHDPDGEALFGLMQAWHKAFGTSPTTVRKAVERAENEKPELLDAIREFPVDDRGSINRNKLGWLLKKNANRIVQGMEFQEGEADGRKAWRVVGAGLPPSPASPVSPVSDNAAEKNAFTSLEIDDDLMF